MKTDEAKAGNFLKAIKKYADKQRLDMQKDVDDFRAQEIKKAQEEGLKDAYALVERKTAQLRADITSTLARKELAGKQELFKFREELVKDIFDTAKDKLVQLTNSPEYKTRLEQWLKETFGLVGKHSAVLSCRPCDVELIKSLCSDIIKGNLKIRPSKTIDIGGFDCYCEDLGIFIDQTLDEKLRTQNRQFREYADLQLA